MMTTLTWRGFSWRAMNTTLTVFAPWQDIELQRGASVWQPSVIRLTEQFEASVSRFRHDSELMRFNSLSTGESIKLSPMFSDLLTDSIELMQHSSGLFHPFLGKRIVELGYDRSFEQLQSGVATAVTDVNFQKPGLAATRHPSQANVWRKIAAAQLDLGGIG